MQNTDPTSGPRPNKTSEIVENETQSGETSSPEELNSRKASSDKHTADAAKDATRPVEIGGQKGPEPTRYGDWEKNGRCTDF